MNNKTDLGSAMQKLVGWMFFNYGGCLVERLSGGKFKVGSQTFDELQDAKDYIDRKYYLLDGRFVSKEVYEESLKQNICS